MEILGQATYLNNAEQRVQDPALQASRRWALVRNLVQLVQRHQAIATGNGEHDEAARLKELALNFIENPAVRAQVELEFVTPAAAPYQD